MTNAIKKNNSEKTLKEMFYEVGSQGNLEFSIRKSMLDMAKKADSIWETPYASIAVMSICMLLDIVMFYQLFSSFLYDAPLILLLAIIAMLIGFDCAPIYLGIVLKKRKQGLDEGVMEIIFFTTAFAVAFIGNVALRLEVKDMVLPDLSAAGTSIMGTEEQTAVSGRLPLLYALFAGSLPVITSLVSFGISFMTSDPLKSKLLTARKKQMDLEDAIVEIESLLVEYDEDGDHYGRLIEEDEELYRNMVEILHERTCYYCDYVRERIKEHLGDPAANNELSKENRNELMRLFEGMERDREEFEPVIR